MVYATALAGTGDFEMGTKMPSRHAKAWSETVDEMVAQAESRGTNAYGIRRMREDAAKFDAAFMRPLMTGGRDG